MLMDPVLNELWRKPEKPKSSSEIPFLLFIVSLVLITSWTDGSFLCDTKRVGNKSVHNEDLICLCL